MESCCTCAVIQPPTSSQAAEKALPQDRRVECCGRIICGKCIQVRSSRRPAAVIASLLADGKPARTTLASRSTVRIAKCRPCPRHCHKGCETLRHTRPSHPQEPQLRRLLPRHRRTPRLPPRTLPSHMRSQRTLATPRRARLPHKIRSISWTTSTTASRPCPSNMVSRPLHCVAPTT